jgi:ankyrin repeat protein
MLIDANAQINVRNSSGETPLHLVTVAGYKKEAARDIAALLLQKGADPNVYQRTGETVQQRDRQGRQTNRYFYYSGGGTILSRAVSQGNADLVALLLDKGADVNLRPPNSEPALSQAIGNNQQDIARLLVEKGADINERGNWSESLLMRLIGYNNEGNKELVRLFIEKGADINAIDEGSGETPLTRTISYGDNKGMLALLLEQGADPNIKNAAGDTPVFKAIARGDKDLVTLLIEKKAKLDLKNTAGQTPLAYATQTQKDEIAVVLRENGAT